MAIPTTSPQGSVNRAGAGVATGRDANGGFVPLSVFFLQLDGDDPDSEEGEEAKPTDPKRVLGYREKEADKGQEKVRQKLGPIHFDSAEKGQIVATKGPRPKPKKPIPRQEWRVAMAEDTMAANIATLPRPIGRPVRQLDPKERRRWMERMSKLTLMKM